MSILDDNIEVDVIGFGALNLDKLYYVNEIAGEDEESFIKDFDVNCGGSAANTIIGLSRLGVSTSYIGKVADDDEGELLEMNLIYEGVYVNNLIYADNGHSGKVLGFIDEEGNRALYVDSGVNDEILSSEIYIDKIANTQILHFSSFIGESFNTQNYLIDKLPDSVVLSFDPGILYVKKGFKALEKILNRTNILLINEKELKILFKDYDGEMDASEIKSLNKDTIKKMVSILFDKGIAIVALKRGNKDVYIMDNTGEFIESSIFPVDAIDTTAAGDSFNAGFLYSYLKGYSLEKSGIIANWLASKCVENLGMSGFPSIEELEEFEDSLDLDK